MTADVTHKSGNTLEIKVTFPWEEIKTAYAKIFDSMLEEIELPGFRKGNAPRELAQKQIDRNRVYEEVLKQIIPKTYSDIVTQHELHPIISPKIILKEAKEGNDWKIEIQACEKPNIQLNDYRGAINKLKLTKKPKIWLPSEKPAEKESELTTVELLEAIYTEIKVELSELLIESELNRLLTHTYNELQKLGLTVEQYLSSQNKTIDTLRGEYRSQATKTLALEFALEAIADKENVSIETSEIDEFIAKAKTDAEKKALENERYILGSILRRQKTLSLLLKSPTLIT